MAQDGKGNIWIGTRNGLVCFDGYTTRRYYHTGRGNSLAHDFIKALFVDSRQRLWVCSQRGLSRYRPASDDFISYGVAGERVQSMAESASGKIFCAGEALCVYNESEDRFDALPSLGEGFIISLAAGVDGCLYVGTNSSIYAYDSTLTRISRLDSRFYSGFITGFDGIMPMFTDSKGRLWIGRNGKGVMAIDTRTWQQTVFPAERLSDGTVRAICEDRGGRIWLGTECGVSVISPDGKVDIVRQEFGNDHLLSDNAVYTILYDRDSNIWIGSYFGGVDMMRGNNMFTWYEPGYGAANIRGKVARMMTEVEPGVLWIATEDAGVNIYDRRTETFARFDRVAGMGDNVHSLYYDRRSSDMWIGTFRHGLFRYNLRSGITKHYELMPGLASNSVFALAGQRNGNLWIATTQGLRCYDAAADTFRLSGDGVLDRNFVYALAVDKHDNVWAGTVRDGLFRVDGRTGRVSRWSKDTHGLSDNYITCVYPAADGKVWIGTNNHGVQLLDPTSGKVVRPIRTAMPDNCTVCSISDDGEGHIYIGTGQGLFRYNVVTKAVARFTTENGLPTDQMNFSSMIMASDGRMYIGTVAGLVAFAPSSLRPEGGPFRVHLKSLTINGTEVNCLTDDSPLADELDNTATLRLSYAQARSFSIEYGVIMPGSNETVGYQLWVEGIDSGWRDVGTERRFVGYKLPPGTYKLHIRANNSSEGWDKCPEKTLELVVDAPFYLTTWAWMCYLLVAVALVYLAQRSYKRRLREKNEIRLAMMEKAKMEEVDRAKSDFFTTVSHELKTPLSLIVAPLRSISASSMDDGARKHLETAIQNTRKLERLIGELVTLNKIESDNFPFYIQKGNPLEFVDIVAASFREMATDRQLKLRVELENNGEDVWFSPSYLECILNNLLSNAFKFTPEGGSVGLTAAITPRDDGFTYLSLEVADTGIGIAPEEQEKIFRRFYQSKRGYSANSQGWGIGLALVKRLADIHKGQVEVVSDVGHGSTFKVWLNVDSAAFDKESLVSDDKVLVPLNGYDSAASMASMAGGGSAGSGGYANPTILIVEDNRDMLEFLHDYFAPRYNVLVAENGARALEITGREAVQLVVSDVMMPGMDGMELCRRLKENVATSHIPVILLTAKNEQDDVVAGYKSGAEAYVAKPFDPRVLDLQVNNILQLVRSRQREIADADAGSVEATSLGPLDKEFMRRVNEIVDEHIADSNFSVADITDGMAISRSLLHTKMRSLVNMSAGEFIRKKRLDMARDLLKKGYTVSETAYRSGFSDPNYFSKVFKKYMGKSPTEFLAERK